ncbi:hypothetical protein KY290_033708 [Solanum tuberosum]|uniref:Uncharacterized protein n=1 Tax=Solanum tuberosum TaxID=4113 RepID=A0ABQ7U1C6_SOLTU|nr:hypothetical protein KY289_033082 [Solanum tuberosum]KAH0647724.1 hypothetical protein KY285_032972 [Solanum tuberosum]KAH0740665.1 hypothetical protein KY290_033708 [Solanum tuberosum]
MASQATGQPILVAGQSSLSINPENFPSLPLKPSTEPQDLTKDQAVSQLGAYANLLKPLHNNASIENKRPDVEPIPIKNVTYIDGIPRVRWTEEEVDRRNIIEYLTYAVLCKFSYGWPDLEDLRIQLPKQLNMKGDVKIGLL